MNQTFHVVQRVRVRAPWKFIDALLGRLSGPVKNHWPNIFNEMSTPRARSSLRLILRFILTYATVRGLRHWNFHLLSCWLTLSLFCDVSHVTMNAKFSWRLVDCCVTYVTEQWQRQLVLCLLGSFVLSQVAGQFIIRLKWFTSVNWPLD